MLRASPPHCAQVAGDVQGLSCPLCTQVVAAQGSRESEEQQQTRACPSHPSVSAVPPGETPPKQELLLGLGHQGGPQRLERLWRAARAVGCLLCFYSVYCGVTTSTCLRQMRLVSIHGSENSGKNKKARPLQGKYYMSMVQK